MLEASPWFPSVDINKDFQTFHMTLDSLWSHLQQYSNSKFAFIAFF